jgi:hypothetical protein
MVANGLDYEQVDSEERSMLKEELMGLCGVVNEGMLVATNYYKWVSEKQINRKNTSEKEARKQDRIEEFLLPSISVFNTIQDR